MHPTFFGVAERLCFMNKITSNNPNLRGVAAKGSGPGRPKGAVNRNTAQLKEMILQALDRAGGVDYLIECATEEKTKGAFLSLIGKVLPMTLAGDPDAPLNLGVTVTFVKPNGTAS
jgi:hypothetical protein